MKPEKRIAEVRDRGNIIGEFSEALRFISVGEGQSGVSDCFESRRQTGFARQGCFQSKMRCQIGPQRRPYTSFEERCILPPRVSRAIACASMRKVRAPKGKMPANGWAGRPDGKCHRKVNSPVQAGEKLKRCGKSAPARWQQRGLENPIWSKRK